MATCSECLRDTGATGHLTQVNPEGGYGRPRVLICDECMSSDKWDDWKARKWPNWPSVPIDHGMIRDQG